MRDLAPCPKCGAGRGDACRTPNDHVAEAHAGRLPVGAPKPEPPPADNRLPRYVYPDAKQRLPVIPGYLYLCVGGGKTLHLVKADQDAWPPLCGVKPQRAYYLTDTSYERKEICLQCRKIFNHS